MKYGEMTKFLNDNGILVMQPVVANMVNAQLDNSISEDEFEDVCESIFNAYIDNVDNPDLDIWYLVDEELTARGYKDDYIPSSTNGDYSPSHPWDAPGMKISDFI